LSSLEAEKIPAIVEGYQDPVSESTNINQENLGIPKRRHPHFRYRNYLGGVIWGGSQGGEDFNENFTHLCGTWGSPKKKNTSSWKKAQKKTITGKAPFTEDRPERKDTKEGKMKKPQVQGKGRPPPSFDRVHQIQG